MLRSTPPTSEKTPLASRAVPVGFNAAGIPPTSEKTPPSGPRPSAGGAAVEDMPAAEPTEELENLAQAHASEPDGSDDLVLENEEDGPEINFLQLLREAEDQALLYVAQVNRRAWSQSLRAFHNEHYVGSKYARPDWRGRSKLFVPKTRAAVRKDNAAVAASLFNSINAIDCIAGNEADPKQRAAAAVMEELVNYRTDRASGKAAFPWFLVAMGARQDAVLTGVCITKQYWLQEFRKSGQETFTDEDGGTKTRDVYKLELDRPEMALFPPENYIIDPSADWRDPAQKAAFLVLKWPMQIEEIRAKQNAPVNPWKKVSEETLKNAVESGKYDMAAIRRARESGLDRLDETQTGTHFQIVWVYETYIRAGGDDYTFFSIGNQEYLTDPRPVREVYPEQAGERPIALGYGQLESHRIYPMSPAESWQPLQLETNDLRNLMLDATKQNVMPISKVRRGRQIDLDQVRRRSSGSSIIVQEPDDVTWEQAPSFPQTTIEMQRELALEFDDLAGQQNYGSVETNNALGKTLGGLKLAAGAANAVQEFDVRVWIETWATHALSQIVRLEQYYEQDKTVLGLVGAKAQLFQKHGISVIDDDLLEQEVTVRVSIGLGAGDPAQRLAKFVQASQAVAPFVAATKEFQSGQVELNWEAFIEEAYGAVGYKDGGKRFYKVNEQPPQQNPMADLQMQELKAKIAKDERLGKAAIMTGLSNVAKVALGKRELESEFIDNMLGRQHEARQLGFDHGNRHMDQHLSARDHGHRHGLDLAEHRRGLANDALDRAQNVAEQSAGNGGGAGMEDAGRAAPAASSAGPQGQPPAPSPPPAEAGPGPAQQPDAIDFIRDHNNRIVGAVPRRAQAPAPTPQPKPEPQPEPEPKEPEPNPHEERLTKLEAMYTDLNKKHGDLHKKHGDLHKEHGDLKKRHADMEAESAKKPKQRVRRFERDANNRITHLVEDVA